MRIAFIKQTGLSYGGTDKWLQIMAAHLPRKLFQVDYYYSDKTLNIGTNYQPAKTDINRLSYLEEHNVNVIKFKIGAIDITKKNHPWLKTNFWQVFKESKYTFVQTAKAGFSEYPFYLINKPVIEYVTLNSGVDNNPNTIWSILISNWLRKKWLEKGGKKNKSSVLPIPVDLVETNDSLCDKLKIPNNSIVAGFHQRVDDSIFSDIPLKAFSKIQKPNYYFLILGGGNLYKRQAKKLALKNVIFLPETGDNKKISQFLNTLDIFTHGRRDGETYGTAITEAMSRGLPILSHITENGDNGHIETIGKAGFVAMTKAEYWRLLKKLFLNKKLRQALGKTGERRYLKEYTIGLVTEKLVHLYKKLFFNNQKYYFFCNSTKTIQINSIFLYDLSVRIKKLIKKLFYLG